MVGGHRTCQLPTGIGYRCWALQAGWYDNSVMLVNLNKLICKRPRCGSPFAGTGARRIDTILLAGVDTRLVGGAGRNYSFLISGNGDDVAWPSAQERDRVLTDITCYCNDKRGQLCGMNFSDAQDFL